MNQEISLVLMPCEASQHRPLFCWKGLPDAGCALQPGRHVCMTSVRCWVWSTTPAGPGFRRLNILYTGSSTASQHALKASTPRGTQFEWTQFDSFSLSQRTSPHQELHEWRHWRVHRTVTGGGCQVPQEMGYPLSRRPTWWLEGESLSFDLSPLSKYHPPPSFSFHVPPTRWSRMFLAWARHAQYFMMDFIICG